jgi:hypothetical protein
LVNLLPLSTLSKAVSNNLAFSLSSNSFLKVLSTTSDSFIQNTFRVFALYLLKFLILTQPF